MRKTLGRALRFSTALALVAGVTAGCGGQGAPGGPVAPGTPEGLEVPEATSTTQAPATYTAETLEQATVVERPGPRNVSIINIDMERGLVRWDPVDGALGYQLQASTDEKTWQTKGTTEDLRNDDLRVWKVYLDQGHERAYFRLRAILSDDEVTRWTGTRSVVTAAAIPDRCLGSMQEAAQDLYGTAEDKFEEAANTCETGENLAAALRLAPGALGYSAAEDVDVQSGVESICAVYGYTRACQDFYWRGLPENRAVV